MKKILLFLLLGLMTFVLSYCEIDVQPSGARRGRYKKQPVYKDQPANNHKKRRYKRKKRRHYRHYRHRDDDDDYDD